VFKNYLATKTDLETIEEGLKTVWRPELDFVFRKKELIASTVVVSYDSKYLYLWVPLHGKPGQYRLQKIPHNITVSSEYHRGWFAGLWKKIEDLLPVSIKKASRFAIPRIGGGLLTPFITLQKSYKVKANPYITRESYLATIIHEFGHIYWEQHKLWWYSNKKENLQYLKTASRLYGGREKTFKAHLSLPSPTGVGELFASCTEYFASGLFWPIHQINFDIFVQSRLEKLTTVEEKKDLDQEDSVLEPGKNPHDFAVTYGKMLTSSYPQTWPQILLIRPKLA